MKIKMIKPYGKKYEEGRIYLVRSQVGTKLVENNYAVVLDAYESIPDKITK